MRNERGQFVKTTGNGRYYGIQRNGIRLSLHRFIWQKHNGDIPRGYIIHHINGNKKDNSIENLACITQKEHNIIHIKDRKIWNSGLVKGKSEKWDLALKKAQETRNKNYKVKVDLVKKLRETMPASSIAKQLNMSTRQIYTILNK